MELGEKQRKFPLMLSELIRFAYEGGLELSLGEAYRTEEQQRIYLERGLARTMASRHRDRLAVGLNLFRSGVYMTDGESYRTLGEKWEALGGRWGGRFGLKAGEYATRVGWDANHFELQ